MNFSKVSYRQSAVFFIVFLALSLWGFWPSYYSRIFNPMPGRVHFHGLVMTLWCLLLVAQGLLIRFNKKSLHRSLGKLSYVLVPLIVISGFYMAHFLLSHAEMKSENRYSNAALMFNSLLTFSLLFALAIYYKHKPMIHARYMMGTVFPIITPITDRLLHHHFKSVLPLLPDINGSPSVWLVGFFLADAILIGFMIRDLRVEMRHWTFVVVLMILLVYQCSVIFFYHFNWWRKWADWLIDLSVS